MSRPSLPRALLLSSLAGCSSAGPLPPVDFAALSAGVHAADPSGAVLLESEAVLDLRGPSDLVPQPHAVLRHRRRLLVTSEAGAALGRITVQAWRGERLDHVVARLTRRVGGSVTEEPIAPSSEPRSSPASVSLDLGAAAPGDVIDSYVERSYLDVDMLPPFSHADVVPVVSSRYQIEAPASFDLRFATGSGAAVERAPRGRKIDLGSGRLAWSFEEKDLPAAGSGPLVAEAQRSGPWVTAVVAALQSDEGANEARAESWKVVGERLVARLEPTMQVDAGFTAQIPQGLAVARLRALRRLYQVEAGTLFAAAPRRFSELGRRASALELAALAVVAGRGGVQQIHLALAVPHAGAVLVDQLPGLYPFWSALAAYEEEGTWRFTDLGCANCAVGQVPRELAGGRAMLLTALGPKIVEIPAGAAEPSAARLQFDWTLSVQGELTGKLIVDLEGLPARRAAEALGSQGGELAAARALLLGSGPELLQLLEAGDLAPEQTYPLSFAVRVGLEAAADGSFSASGVSLVGHALPWADVSAEGARCLPAPLELTSTATVQLPPGYVVDFREPRLITSALGEYEAKIERDGTVLIYTRRVKVTAHMLEGAASGEWRKLLEAVRAADLSPILVRVE